MYESSSRCTPRHATTHHSQPSPARLKGGHMGDHDDPVDAVILAFLDYLEGVAPRPTLHHLAEHDRVRAEAFLDGLTAARGIDPRAQRPSVDSLLADTPLAGLMSVVRPLDIDSADLTAVQHVLAGV